VISNTQLQKWFRVLGSQAKASKKYDPTANNTWKY